MIILAILKWVGIVLLCILLLLLALVLCILFVPVRYRISVQCTDQWRAWGNVSWLLYIIKLSFDTTAEQGTCLRIFGIPVSRDKRQKRPKSTKKRKKKKKAPSIREEMPSETHKNLPGKSAGKAEVQKNSQPEARKKAEAQKSLQPEVRQNPHRDKPEVHKSTQPESREKMRNSWWSRIRKRLGTLYGRIKKTILSIRDIFDKIKAVDREELEMLRLLIQKTGRLLKHIFPKKLRGWIHFGTSDPALTGEILGALGVFFAMYGQGIRVTPDFEQSVFEGEAEIRGSLMGIVLLILIIQVHPLQLIRYFEKKQ